MVQMPSMRRRLWHWKLPQWLRRSKWRQLCPVYECPIGCRFRVHYRGRIGEYMPVQAIPATTTATTITAIAATTITAIAATAIAATTITVAASRLR